MSADIIARLRDRSLLELVERIAAEHHVTVEDVCSRWRAKSVSAARHKVWSRLRVMGLSLPEIGALFGRDHTTVLVGVRRAHERATASVAGKRTA